MTKAIENWPFERWHQIAIRRFNLHPDAFWNMPLRDWLALLEAVKPQGLDRQSLDDLLTLYPDEGGTDEPD